jgi:hypothetical protein
MAKPTTLPLRVDLGAHVYVTDGVRVGVTGEYMHECLAHHARGDWGVCDAHDTEVNTRTLDQPYAGRVLSAYPIDASKPCTGYGPNTLWIITEWHAGTRHTTLLLPDEY